MAQFDVNIALKVLAEGFRNFESLVRNFEDLRDSIESTVASASSGGDGLRNFAAAIIGAGRRVDDLDGKLETLQRTIAETGSGVTANALAPFVASVRRISEGIKEVNASKISANTDDALSSIKTVENAINGVIRSLEGSGEDTRAFVGLKNALAQIKTEIGKINAAKREVLDPVEVKVDTNTLNERLNNVKQAFERLGDSIGGVRAFDEINRKINEIKRGVQDEDDFKINLNAPGAIEELKLLEKSLDGVIRQAKEADDLDLFNVSAAAKRDVIDLRNEVSRIVKARDDLDRKPLEVQAKLGRDIIETNKKIAELRRNIDKADETGQLIEIRPKLSADANDVVKRIADIQRTLQSLGQSDVRIRVTAREVDQLIARLNTADESQQKLNRQKITVDVVGDEIIRTVYKDIDELAKRLEKLKREGKVKLALELETDVQSLRSELARIKPIVESSRNRPKIELFDRQSLRLGNISNELKNIERSIPRGVLGFFSGLADRFRNANQQIGGLQGSMRAAAGTFRLIGTAAFLVGGQLRTLGFAGSALGSILQNFGPLAIGITKALGPIGPVVVALAASFALFGAQLLVAAGALAKVIETGLKFNDEFKRTQNSVSAIAREFFQFNVVANRLPDSLAKLDPVNQQLAISGAAVKEQLRELQIQASQTEFTAQDLFAAFKSSAIAFGGFAPSLGKVTEATGLFAKAASIAGVPIQELSSSISQVVGGVGRVTNKLQRNVFDQLKDSEGIALTAERIRQLRDAGGTRVFDEITGALGRYTEGIGELQADTTLRGTVSNVQDAFEIFSGLATEQTFNTLTNGLKEIRDILFPKNAEGKAELSKSVKDLAAALSPIIDTVAKDLVGAFKQLVEFILSLTGYIDQNYENFILMYEAAKEIVLQIGYMIKDFAELLGLSNSTGASFSFMNMILVTIVATVLLLRTAFNVVYTGLLFVIRGVGTLAAGVAYVLDLLGQGSEFEEAAARFNATVDANLKERLDGFREISDQVKQFGERIRDINTAKSQQPRDALSVETVSKTAAEEAEKREKRARLSTLKGYENLYTAIINLAKNSEENQLKLTQARLERQQGIVQSFIDLSVEGESAGLKRIGELRQQALSNEIQSKKNQIRVLTELAVFGERESQDEVARLKEDELEKDLERQNTAQLQAKIDSIALKQAAERVKRAQEISTLNAEIKLLEESRLDIQVDILKQQILSTVELQKQRQELRASVAELQAPDSGLSLAERFNLQIFQVQQRILSLNNELSGLTQRLNNETLPDDIRKSLEDRVALISEIIELTKRDIALRQQSDTFRTVETGINNQLIRLREREEQIAREIARGTITESDGVVRITALRRQYRRELENVLKTLQRIAQENPLDEKQRQTIVEITRALEDLGDTLTEDVLLRATDEARQNFVDLFVKFQENIGDAKNSLRDFANSMLGIFRRLIAERVVREFFNELFPEPGQVQGRARGIFASILRVFDLDPNTQRERIARGRASGPNPQVSSEVAQSLENIKVFDSLKQREADISSKITTANNEYLDTIRPLVDQYTLLSDALTKLTTNIGELDIKGAIEKAINSIVEAGQLVSEQILERIQSGELFKEILSSDRGGTITSRSLLGNREIPEFTPSAARLTRSGRADIDKFIDVAATKSNIDPTILTELLRQESAFDPRIISGKKVSSAGAVGIAQFMPDAARRFGLITPDGVDRRTDPKASIEAAAKYLRVLLDMFDQNYELALSAYNAGEGRIGKFRRDTEAGRPTRPLAKETLDYAPSILQRAAQAQSATDYMNKVSQSLNRSAETAKKASEDVGKAGGSEKAAIVPLRPDQIRELNLEISLLRNAIAGKESLQFAGVRSKEEAEARIREKQAILSGRSPLLTPEQEAIRRLESVDRSPVRPRALRPDEIRELQQEISFLKNVLSGRESLKSSGFKTKEDVQRRLQFDQDVLAGKEFLPEQTKVSIDSTAQSTAKTADTTVGIWESLKELGRSIFKGSGEYAVPRSDKKALNFIEAFLPKKASGGFISGAGGSTEDKIPAMLSNGEYVMRAAVVKMLGKGFFDRLNQGGPVGFARGGEVLIDRLFKDPSYVRPLIDATKYNYAKGGAELINKPAPIVEKPKPVKKKGGGLKGFFGNLFSFIAPFMNFIPGIGPFLALGLGSLGGALSGSENGVLGGVVGGLLGGLGNLGGFAGKGGTLGKLGDIFGKGKGAGFLSLFGASSGLGNVGGSLGQLLSRLKLGDLKGILGKLGLKFAVGGLASLSGIFGSIGNIFGGGSSGKSGSGISSLLLLLGSSLFGSLFNRQSQSPDEEVLVDPDEARKNRFGSAYNKLIEFGTIPGFKYLPETLEALKKGRLPVKLERQSGGGFFGFLSQILPLLSLLGLGGSGRASVGGSASRSASGIIDKLFKSRGGMVSKFAGGGLASGSGLLSLLLPLLGGLGSGGSLSGILPLLLALMGGNGKALAGGGKVSGPGTSTSDSIPAMLSNGEYVIRASAVKNIGLNVLDHINSGRFKFAEGGLAGEGVSTLPNIDFGGGPATTAVPEVNVENKTSIMNILDPSLIGDYFATSQGTKQIMNIISSRPKEFARIVGPYLGRK